MRPTTVIIALTMLVSGCGTVRAAAPWDRADYLAASAALVGQVADGASSWRFLDRGYDEGNPLLAGDSPGESKRNVALAKVGIVLFIWAMMAIQPDHASRRWLGWFCGTIGLGAASWNAIQTEDVPGVGNGYDFNYWRGRE
jgi:hypothetical protein